MGIISKSSLFLCTLSTLLSFGQDKATVTDDAYVRGGSYANNNFGAVNTLLVKTPSSNVTYLRNTFLKYDVSNYENVSSAKLYIYAKAKTNLNASINYVSNDNWNEGSITYNNAPSFSAHANASLTTAYRWVSVDVTSLVQAETTSGNGTLSLAVSDNSNQNKMIYIYSKELSGGAYASYLEITEDEVEENDSRDIFLVIGQSNTAGRGLIEAQDNVALSGVDLLNANGAWEAARGGMNRYSTIKKTTAYQGVNYSYTFGKVMNQITGKQIGIVCNAQGGTNISQWAVGGTFYNEAVARTRQALNAGGELKGILWHQGEANRNSTSTYLNSLNTIVTALRNEFGNVPLIAGQLSQDRDDDNDNDNFNNMMEGISSVISSSDYAESVGLTTNADGLESGSEIDETHFDNYSQRILGRRYATKALELAYGMQTSTILVPATDDSYTRAGSYVNNTYGNETLVRIKERGDTNNNTRRTYVKFNTSNVSGRVIDASVVVSGNVRSGTEVLEAGIYETNNSWTEGSVNFSNAPALGDKLNIINFRGTATATYNMPISSYFIDNYSAGSISLGLKGENSGNEQFRFYSSETSNAPYIMVTVVGGSSAAKSLVVANEDTFNSTELLDQPELEVVTYPNPVVDYLNINSNGNISQVIISNLLGQSVINTQGIDSTEVSLNLANLNNGTYVVSVVLENGTVETTKIIK